LTDATPSGRIAAAWPGADGERWFRAPGRVNLMGDHTDYNDGLVLPIAVQLEVVLAAVTTADGRVRLRSLEKAEPVDVAADGSDEPSHSSPAWGRYVAGVVRALAQRGRPAAGVDGVLASSLPLGSGLSSSAALEVAVALALCSAGGLDLEPSELALACREAEHSATGVPSGVMDQLASAAARHGHALLVDCRTLEVKHVPMPDSVGVLVVHSGVSRTLGGTAYMDRADATRRLAASLGVPALRDASLDDVRADPLGRHVVTENERVRGAARALATGDLDALGHLFAESQRSLRDDYRVSTPELDALVDELGAAGAQGARLTGAGFGGAVVAVCERGEEDGIAARALPSYMRRTGREPAAYQVRPVEGAGRLATEQAARR
jgi:galactokinase